MSPVDRIRKRLAGLGRRKWGQTCPEGTPVPDDSRCAECDSVPLTALAANEGGVVTCLQEPESRASVKLAAMGVLPGTAVTLVQRYPAYVFRVGYSEFAVDAELASRIRVRRE